jgi:hypothetical protein
VSLDEAVIRLRDRYAGDPRVTEKKAFGGIMFLINGNMVVSAKKDGRMLFHVNKDQHDGAAAREGAEAMVHGGKPMRGFIWVEAWALEEDDALEGWLALAEACAAALPPK